MGHNSAPGSPDTDRPGGGLGLTAEAHARSEGQLARKKNLESGARRISTFNGTFDGVTRRHRGGSDGLRAGWLAGLAPIQLPSGASSRSDPERTVKVIGKRCASLASGECWGGPRFRVLQALELDRRRTEQKAVD